MPLDRGAAGKVMLAALGTQGPLYDEIRARGFHVTIGEAKQASASIAVPVFGSRWRMVGALCIGARPDADVEARLTKLAPRLKRAAESLSAALSFDGDLETRRVTAARSTWHP
jgi:DNA-binding IclR family transcriptional regulator